MKATTLGFILSMLTLSANTTTVLKRPRRAIVDTCTSMVYCQGNLLDTIQRMRIYADSKTFVDLSQIYSESVTLSNFDTMMQNTNNTPTKQNISRFLDENFVSEAETETWTPIDFKKSPAFLKDIYYSNVKTFATEIVSFWPQLGRKVKDSVKNDPSKHSLIPVPQGFIVPGGRFREIYYWDSYWIIKGLIISEMYDTARGMLENFVYFIKNYGFIPNGSRVYYLNRSQPPLFALMVGIYMDSQNDLEWLRNNLEYIETELLFWINNRIVSVTKDDANYDLAHYGPESNTPRPESYAEDLITCSTFSSDEEKRTCYNALKTGAETGWDFSTRWLFDEKGNTNTNLTKIDTQRIVPVDLNAFLYKGFSLLSEFYGKIGNSQKQSEWSNQANKWLNSIENVLYNQEDGIWYDYDKTLNRQRNVFFASNFAPLWADAYDLNRKEEYGKKAVEYFYDKKINEFLGGIPTSLEESGEQWDMPNAWPPLQEFVILGLHKTGNLQAKETAQRFATRWINANMVGYERHKALYEKYDAVEAGAYGGGGEYDVQIGFGWTNGVALSLINTFYSHATIISKSLLNIFFYSGFLSILVYVVR